MIQFSPEVPKAPTEVIDLVMDFARWMAAGETISSCTWSCSVHEGIDPAPQAMLQGAATHSGSKATQKVAGGIEGVIYLFSGTVTTSAGNTFVGRALLRVATAT